MGDRGEKRDRKERTPRLRRGVRVGGSRLELLTSTMSTWRSNQLS